MAEDYNGPREADAIVSHVAKIASFRLPEIKTANDLSDLARDAAGADAAAGRPVVLGLFRMPIGASAAFKAFKTLAFEATSQPVVFAYSAAYGNPPVMPLVDGMSPPLTSM